MPRSLVQLRPAALIASAIALAGCASTPRAAAVDPRANQSHDNQAPRAEADLFQPARVRIHPLTHYIPGALSQDPSQIDVHIELLDRWGLPVRALGTLRFVARLTKAQTAAIARSRPDFAGPIVWSIDLTNPEQNALRFYDPVTRTYHITLSDPALSSLASPFTLEVVFLAPGLAVLPASRQITPHGVDAEGRTQK